MSTVELQGVNILKIRGEEALLREVILCMLGKGEKFSYLLGATGKIVARLESVINNIPVGIFFNAFFQQIDMA